MSILETVSVDQNKYINKPMFGHCSGITLYYFNFYFVYKQYTIFRLPPVVMLADRTLVDTKNQFCIIIEGKVQRPSSTLWLTTTCGYNVVTVSKSKVMI